MHFDILRCLKVAAVVAAFGGVAPHMASAQVAVSVSEATVVAAVASCTSPDECNTAIQSLIDSLVAANPDVDLGVIIGTVVSAIATAYNDGKIPAAAAETALTTTASIATSNGYADLAAAATVASTVVASGGVIDLEAVAEASGSPT